MKKEEKNTRNEFGYPNSLRKNTRTRQLIKQQKAEDNRNEYGYPKECVSMRTLET
jgi:hypothetical protein